MNAKFLICIFALAMCSLVQEASAQYYDYSGYYGGYPSYYGGYGLGSAYAGYYGGYGYGAGYGYYGKRSAGFGVQQQQN